MSKALVQLGRPFGYHDFSRYPLDGPFPDLGDLGANGYRSAAERIKRIARDERLTVRQAALRFARHRSPFVGSARTVAGEIERWFRDGALDGIIVGIGEPTDLAELDAQVLPILRARGLVRTDYADTTLRGHLGLAVPQNRHTAAREDRSKTAAE